MGDWLPTSAKEIKALGQAISSQADKMTGTGQKGFLFIEAYYGLGHRVENVYEFNPGPAESHLSAEGDFPHPAVDSERIELPQAVFFCEGFKQILPGKKPARFV